MQDAEDTLHIKPNAQIYPSIVKVEYFLINIPLPFHKGNKLLLEYFGIYNIQFSFLIRDLKRIFNHNLLVCCKNVLCCFVSLLDKLTYRGKLSWKYIIIRNVKRTLKQYLAVFSFTQFSTVNSDSKNASLFNTYCQ